MSGFFKSFGRGILYVIFLPFILLCLALYSVIGIIILFLLSIKSIVLFFKAKTIFSPLEEDEQAALIIHKTKSLKSFNTPVKKVLELIILKSPKG